MHSLKIKKNLIAIGGLTFTAAVLWFFWVGPKLVLLPKDFNFTADIVSVDNFFDEERGEYSGGIYSKTKYEYLTVSSDPKNLILKNVFSVRTPEDQPIFSVERLYGVERETGKHVSGLGDKDREGYLFAPRHLKKGESFIYWHINYDAPANMEFVGTESLYGLKTYHYQTRYQDQHIEQTKNLTHLPQVGETRGIEVKPFLELWVEPVTGRLIKYKDETVAYYYDLKNGSILFPWNHFSNTFDEQSVEKIVQDLLWEKTKSRIFELYIPILLILISLFLFFKGFVLERFFKNFFQTHFLTVGASLLILSVAFITLLGWASGNEAMIFIVPHIRAMNPITALGFLFLASGILLKIKNNHRLILMIGLILVTGASIRILGSLHLIHFNIDLILFKEEVLSLESPARMGMYTAISFFLMGVAFISNHFKKTWNLHLAEIICSVSILFSLLAISGYLFEASKLLNIPLFFSVSLQTALLFLISGFVIYKIFRQNNESILSFKNWSIVSGVLFFCIFMTILLTGLVERNLTQQARNQFEIKINESTKAISDRLEIYVNALEGARGLFNASDSVEREEWGKYVDSLNLQKNYPGIQGMGYSIFIPPEEKEEHIQKIRAEGFPDYTLKPEGERDLYSSIVYIEPFDKRNQQAFGYDMFSNDVRRSAMEQARDTGEPKMSGKITLVQEIDEEVQSGFLIYVPIYKAGAPNETLEEKRENIIGYVYSPFRATDFIEGVLGKGGLKEIGLDIDDGTLDSIDHELYNDKKEKVGNVLDQKGFWGRKTIYIASHPWSLDFYSAPNYGQTLFTRLIPIITILTGIFISTLITLIVYTLISSRQKAVLYANEVTKNLKDANLKLEKTHKEILKRVDESERMNKIMVDRELKMIEIKQKLKSK